MIEDLLLWFVFMAFLLVVNLYAMTIHFRIVHVATIAIILMAAVAMWGDFAGFEVIALGMILLGVIVPVMGMFR